MKKLLAVVLALVLMIPTSGFAEKKYVYALTFCELYTERMLKMESYLNLSVSNIGIEPYTAPYLKKDDNSVIVADCSAGTLYIRKDDMKIVEWLDILMIINSDSDSFYRRMSSCAAAISALEYDVTEASILKLKGYDPAIYVYQNILSGIIYDKNILDKAFSVGNVLIYEGKYKYYLNGKTIDGYNSSEKMKVLSITAK